MPCFIGYFVRWGVVCNNGILSWRLICDYCVLQHFAGLEAIVAADL